MPVGLGLVAAVVFALGWLPPLARPGYELALATGLMAPSLVAVASGLEQRTAPRALPEALRRALAFGCVAALAACAMAAFHGVRTGFCEPREGFTLFALGPMAGLVMASVWGLLAVEVVRATHGDASRSAWTVLAALAGPLGSLVCGVLAFYATPMVFAYDPFVGFFSGSFYDTVVLADGLWTYRLASAATLVSAAVLAHHVERKASGVRFVWRGRPFEFTLGVAAFAVTVGSVWQGPALGHWQTASTIARALGVTTAGAVCRVTHEPALGDEAKVVLRECEVHVRELSLWLGIEHAPPIEVFLFRDAEQKRGFMGAAHTSIAKPWRHEIYIQNEEFPHPVLRHELAHVLAAELARGPFRVAGTLGGWLPDPGLIEGLAEAAALRDDELSSDEWAAAMRTLGVLPAAGKLFGLGFFGGASSANYTAAGSFVAYVRAHHGAPAVARWYRGERLEEVVGASILELERRWWEELDAVRLTDNALAEARLRFDHPGVFERSCPHAVDRMLGEAGPRESGDPERALAVYRAVLDLDPGHVRAMFGIASCHDRAGREREAAQELRGLATSALLPEAARAMAAEKVGDLALRAGDVDQARHWYDNASGRVFHEDRLRTLELKRHYAADPVGRAALVSLLVGADEKGPNGVEAMDRIGEWRAGAKGDGVPAYLAGRQLANAHRWKRAAETLDDALAAPLLPRVLAEALRLRIRVACMAGDGPKARELGPRFAASEVVSPARKRWVEALVARCQ